MSGGISTKEGTKIIIDKGLPLAAIIGGALSPEPYMGVLFTLAGSLFGTYLSYSQSKINELSNFFIENKQLFSEELLGTETFREGFLKIFESYIKSRTLEKRKLIQKLIVEFSKLNTTGQAEFELERYLNLIDTLSIKSIDYIKFLSQVIEPYWSSQLEQRAREYAVSSDLGEAGWLRIFKRDEPMTQYVEKWIWENNNYNGAVPSEVDRLSEIQESLRNKHRTAMSELVSTGIFNTFHTSEGGGIGSGGTVNRYEYSFNNFGRFFIKILA